MHPACRNPEEGKGNIESDSKQPGHHPKRSLRLLQEHYPNTPAEMPTFMLPRACMGIVVPQLVKGERGDTEGHGDTEETRRGPERDGEMHGTLARCRAAPFRGGLQGPSMWRERERERERERVLERDRETEIQGREIERQIDRETERVSETVPDREREGDRDRVLA